jgi:hypothetical protein
MKIIVAEFRPKNLNKLPIFWKLVLDIIGTGYYHTGILIHNRYFEMYESGYRELPFTSFEQLNHDRGLIGANKYNAGDVIDFFEIPQEFSQEQIDVAIKWWQGKIKPGMFFGYIRFIELAFARTFRKLSEWYHRKTGKILLFAKTDAERQVRVCSGAVDECLRSIGCDLFPDFDETITVPGSFAKVLKISYKGI